MQGFSQDQVDTIFLRWYKGEKVDSLFKELCIQRISGCSFAKHFPPILCELSCPYCLETMYAFRSDSAYYKKSQSMYDISTAHCRSCGHDIKKACCKCEGCELRREEEELILAEKKAESLSKRAEQLDRLYNSIVPIDFDTDNLIELIYLYTLCYQSTSEHITLISPPSTAEAPLTPSEEWDRDMIRDLLNYIAPLSDDENLLEIADDGSATWSGQKVFYRIKINGIDETDFLDFLLIHIKQRIKNFSLDEKFALASIIEKLMITECIAYLEYMRGDFQLPHEVGPKTIALFKKLIQNWRIDQIYTIIWGRCKDALAYKVQKGISKQHASNLIVGMIDKYVDKVTQNNWEVKGYYRDSKNRQSSISYVLFNKILGLGGVGIEYNYQDVLTKLGQFDQAQLESVEAIQLSE